MKKWQIEKLFYWNEERSQKKRQCKSGMKLKEKNDTKNQDFGVINNKLEYETNIDFNKEENSRCR